MNYKIRFDYNGVVYEDTCIDYGSEVEDVAYEALRGCLVRNNLTLDKDCCLRNIELFVEGKEKAVYSAVTYTEGMGFVIVDNEEYSGK